MSGTCFTNETVKMWKPCISALVKVQVQLLKSRKYQLLCDCPFKHGKDFLESHSCLNLSTSHSVVYLFFTSIYVSLYRCGGSNIIFYSWGNCESNILAEKVHKEDEWATALPSLLSRAIYSIWQTGPKKHRHPSFLCLPMAYPCGILQNSYPNFKGTVFSFEPAHKKCWIFEEFQQPAIQTKIVQQFGWFFHQIKLCQRIGRKDSIQTACRSLRRLQALYLAAQNFKLFSKVQTK